MPRNEAALNGLTVLVTRPRGQAEALCRLIEEAGGRAVHMPVLAIRPLASARLDRELESAVAGADQVLFVSPNAVRVALERLPGLAARLGDKSVTAVGAATRQALLDTGIDRVLHTEGTPASEALLALPELAAARVRDRRIVIIRGTGGRELLAQELQRRGARVQSIEIYQRGLPEIPPDQIQSLWHHNRPDLAVITSVAGLENLVQLTPEANRAQLFATRLVVISDRIGEAARGLGFSRPPLVAAAASDAGLLRAMTARTE